MLVMVVFFIAFRWIHLSTPLIRLFLLVLILLFFFSSRRRHTRCGRDWSSDVCSSDLNLPVLDGFEQLGLEVRRHFAELVEEQGAAVGLFDQSPVARHGARERAGFVPEQLGFQQFAGQRRSEERRVGKEWRAGGWAEQ